MSEAAAGPSRLVRLAFGGTIGLYAAVCGWLVWRVSVLEPFSDMIDWIDRWLALQRDGDLLRYYWTPHNFHHLLWTLGVLDLDARAAGGQGYLFLAVGAACMAGVAAMIAGLGARAAGPGMRLVGGGVALALSLMGCHVIDASIPINTTYYHALIFAVAAILLSESRSPGGRFAALACACAASFGSAAGLAVWPALAFTALRGRRFGWLSLVLAAGAINSGVYMLGEGAAGGVATVGHAGFSAVKSGLLFISFLGLPWMRAAPVVGPLIGLTVLMAGLAAAGLRGGKEAPSPDRIAVTLIVFSLGTAAMAGLARTGDMAPDLVPMRYAVFLIPLQVGLWILALPWVRRAWAGRPRVMDAVLVGLCLGLLAHQGVMAIYAVRTGDITLRDLADWRAGGRSPEVVAVIYPIRERAERVSAVLKARGFYQHELRRDPPAAARRGSAPGTSASWTGR